MFALRSSPDAGDKRKRPAADSEPRRRPTSPLPRLSPPPGHRSVQALAKRQSMPFVHEDTRGGDGWEQTTFSSRPDTNTSAKTGHSQARHFVPLKSASEPRETRLPDYQPRVEHSDTQPHYSRPSNEKPPIRLSTEDTIVASPVMRRSNDGKTGRGQAHGTVKKSAKTTLQKDVSNSQVFLQTPLGRSYLEFENKSSTFGAIIPDGWEIKRLTLPPRTWPDLPFHCPVTDCHKVYKTDQRLGLHFSTIHADCLFNDNRDGTLSIKGSRENGQGCAVVSQIARSTKAETLAEPQLEYTANDPFQNAEKDIANLSPALPQSVHTASPSTSVEDQQADKGKKLPSKTTWDAALEAHPCLREAFPARPNNDTVAFLANLPAGEGALDESPKLNIVNGRVVEKGFALSRAQPWKDKRLQAALAQSHGILSESPCLRCAAGKGVYTTCVRAPTRPGESQDVFDGACVNCFYSGLKHKCECRSGVNFEQGAGTRTPLMTFDDPPPEKHRERHQGEAEQSASSALHSEDEISQGDGAQSVPANGKDAHDSKHRLQDQVVRYAYRVRALPIEQRQAVTEQIESLLGGDGFEPDVLDIARCVYDLPEEERAQSSKMIIQILRGLLI